MGVRLLTGKATTETRVSVHGVSFVDWQPRFIQVRITVCCKQSHAVMRRMTRNGLKIMTAKSCKHTHARTHTRTHTHTHARTHTRTHARMQAHTHTHTQPATTKNKLWSNKTKNCNNKKANKQTPPLCRRSNSKHFH